MPDDDDLVYDDGSPTEVVCEDGDPIPDPYVESHDAIEHPTDEEVELGEFLRAMIDPDDDLSNGSEWAGVTAAELEAMAADVRGDQP